MATQVKHKFVSEKADTEDTTLIRPSNWNDEHDITVDHTDLENKGEYAHAEIDDHIENTSIHTPTNHNHDSSYAPISKGVTNGDSHNHAGGDGAQIDHAELSNKGNNSHSQIDSHIGDPYIHIRSYFGRVTGSDATTTGTTLTYIPGLLVSLGANKVYAFEAVLSCNSSTTAGIRFGVDCSAISPTIEAQITGTGSSTTPKAERIHAFNTATGAFITVASDGVITIRGTITTGNLGGDLVIQYAKVTSGTAKVYINSRLSVQEIP